MRTIVLSMALAAFLAGISLAADAKAGAGVYDKSCKSCHGADGTANPAIAKMMKVDIKDLKSPEVQSRSDADIKKIISEGQGKMKPVASVTGPSQDDVVAYIRTLKK